MSTFYVPPRFTRHLYLLLVLAGLMVGCAGSRLMYAGPITHRPKTSPGLMLEGPDNRPVECYPEPTDSFSDLEVGQWVIAEGVRSHEGELAIGLRECRVLAATPRASADGPGLELRRRGPRPPPPPATRSQGTPSAR